MSHLRLVMNDDGDRPAPRREDERPLAELRLLLAVCAAEPQEDDGPELDPAA